MVRFGGVLLAVVVVVVAGPPACPVRLDELPSFGCCHVSRASLPALVVVVVAVVVVVVVISGECLRFRQHCCCWKCIFDECFKFWRCCWVEVPIEGRLLYRGESPKMMTSDDFIEARRACGDPLSQQ